jgi:hypothetical protein
MNNLIWLMLTFCMSFGLIGLSHSKTLQQGAWVQGKNVYVKGHRSIAELKINNAPSDIDWKRSAMLHDGSVYRLYFFKKQSSDTLYQFGFNPQTSSYEYGYKSIPVISIVGKPNRASAKSFAMLHDGKTFRLFMQDVRNPTLLYQFAFNPRQNRYEYGLNSIPTIKIEGMPSNLDRNRWGMLHDGQYYRLYMGKAGSSSMYQAAFNPSTNQYEYGFKSVPQMKIRKFFKAGMSDFALLHDRKDFRLYILK